MYIAAEPFEEPLVLTVEDRVGPNKDEILGMCMIPLQNVQRRLDHKPVNTRWFNLEKHVVIEGEQKKKETKFSSRIHLRVCLEDGYHMLDESTHYSSDLRPTTKQLWKSSIGILEVGIISAQGLMLMKTRDGKGTTYAHCVAKYGQKWIRTWTIMDSLVPKWNKEYILEVFDPCTVITIGDFDNGHLHGGDKSGVKKMGEMQLAIVSNWNLDLQWRPRHPPPMDTRLSHADELDDEFDTFPISRSSDIIRKRYDRLRSIAGRFQTVVGDLTTQEKRFHNLLSWRDIRLPLSLSHSASCLLNFQD
ncbi:hypothetical protein VNO77_04503 [Canavalia gladiata]|uniref:C2 domain-containing protein n=1 Tax=Canavalia gladiata TaxID=3824 RepID=A0AAN9N1S1_CANGL